MDKAKLNKFKEKLVKAYELEQEIKKEANEIRSWYKYQNEETRSISEDLIVNISNDGCYEEASEYIDDLIEYEER